MYLQNLKPRFFYIQRILRLVTSDRLKTDFVALLLPKGWSSLCGLQDYSRTVYSDY